MWLKWGVTMADTMKSMKPREITEPGYYWYKHPFTGEWSVEEVVQSSHGLAVIAKQPTDFDDWCDPLAKFGVDDVFIGPLATPSDD